MLSELETDAVVSFWSRFRVPTLARLNLSFNAFYEMLWRGGAKPLTVGSFGSGSCSHEIALALIRPELRVHCFDQTDRYIPEWSHQRLEELGNVDFTLFDFSRPPDVGQFDLVFSIQTLEHVEDSDAALEQLAGAVAPRGWLYIDTPVFHEDPEREPDYDQHRKRAWENNQHFHLGFSRVRQEQRIRDLGLRVINSGYYSYFCADFMIMRCVQECFASEKRTASPEVVKALDSALWDSLIWAERAYRPQYQEIDQLLLKDRVCYATRILARR